MFVVEASQPWYFCSSFEWTKTCGKGAKTKDNKFGSGHIVSQIQVPARSVYGNILLEVEYMGLSLREISKLKLEITCVKQCGH